MKHIVEIKYTNPSHEHVSLRRRVETVNRVVEAQSADEALNRAANQQRSLGFRIQSANIVEQVLAEEIEQLDEGKLGKALAVGAMSLASMGAKAHTDTTKSVADLARERPAVSTLLSKIGAQGQVPASDKRAAELQKKQDQEMPASERRATELSKMKKEEVGADKRDAGYKMSPAVRKAQGESDRLSKVVKPVQAGTLAAQRRRAEMKKEEVETVDEGVMSGLKKAQVKWRTAHRAVYGTDPSAKSMVVGAIAKLAGAKASTARAVGSAVGGKPVSKQQQAAAIKRAGKPAMARMRNEEKDTAGENDVNSNVKGKLAADKMTKKAAEIRKAKIEGGVNEINLEPMIDLHRPASLDPNKRIQK